MTTMEFELKKTKKELFGFLKTVEVKVSMKMKKIEMLSLYEKYCVDVNTTGDTLEINDVIEIAGNLLEANKFYEQETQTEEPTPEEIKITVEQSIYNMEKIEAYLKTQGLTLYDFSHKKELDRIITRNRKYNLNL